MKIVCVGWKLSMEENNTLANICNYIKKNIEKADVLKTDSYRHNIIDADKYICFGNKAYASILDKKWLMPEVKELSTKREESIAHLNKIMEEFKLDFEEKNKEKKIYVETDKGITIGKEACDIDITEQEIEYLKKLKSMLDGSKMIITKGDIRIEVE